MALSVTNTLYCDPNYNEVFLFILTADLLRKC